MNKDSKSIFKMQEAGNIPEVNQYGLTEEQMQSVRDYMRRYGLSEEEAVANKISALNTSKSIINETMSGLNGPVGDTYRNQSKQLTPIQKTIYQSNIDEIKDQFHNTMNGFYHSIKYDPYWKIRLLQNTDRLLYTSKIDSDRINKYLSWITNRNWSNKNPTDPIVQDEINTMRNGIMRNYTDYNKYKQEYLDSHPEDKTWYYFPENYNNITSNTNPIISRNQEAHDYALSKLEQQHEKDQTLANFFPNSSYFQQKLNENKYDPNFQSPSDQFATGVKQGTAIGTAAGLTLATPFLLGPEFTASGAGLLGGIARTAGGFIGSGIGSKIFGSAGKWIDSHVDYNKMASFYEKSNLPGSQGKAQFFRWLGSKKSPIKSLGDFAGGWIGWGKGADLAYKAGIKGFNAYLGNKAKHAFMNGTKNITFNIPEKLIGQEMQWAAGMNKLNGGYPPYGSYHILKSKLPGLDKRGMEFRFYNPKYMTPAVRSSENINSIFRPLTSTELSNTFERQLVPSLLYKNGGRMIRKHQVGGLVYKPFFPETNVESQNEETLSYEPYVTEEESFQVEPVKIYSQRITRNPIVQEEPVMQEVETQADNTRVEKPIMEGKIYKSSEKQQFKEDLYSAYLKELRKKGIKENDAEEFAKRLTTQDILESNWGQSSLSKNFNFGGIKDFSGKGTVKDTTEVVDGKAIKVKQPFRKFENIEEYVNYKISLVDRKWNVFKFNPDKYYSLIVSGQQKYATDPNYVSKLNNLYKQIWK